MKFNNHIQGHVGKIIRGNNNKIVINDTSTEAVEEDTFEDDDTTTIIQGDDITVEECGKPAGNHAIYVNGNRVR